MAQKVLLFGDIGIDDTVALIYAYLNDEIDVVGVVADYGNISRENALANIQYVRTLLSSEMTEQVTIIVGAEAPMTGELPVYVPEIHGEFGLGPIIPPLNFMNGITENFHEIVDIIKENEDLLIVNIGRLTSLATMFLLYGDLMRKVKGYYVMGGAFWVPGNITAVSEANFYGDPVAAQVVLRYAENLKIIPLNVTEQAIATPKMVDYIDAYGPIDIVKPLLDYYYNFYKERNPSITGSPLHDVLTLMAAIKPDMLTYERLPVHIVQAAEGTERGQSIADIRPFLTDGEVEPNKHDIAFQLNYKQFFMDFMTVMSGQRFT
ncbi:Pyrimidine-specific ribonucleoside hydrolase RihA [Oceanobacillus picturae]|uniref:Pyrimidine-specific ribonucleoside hydrolase RihA n=1 Tax=Oceanobacillus picturae TaxID=171693 RepID=W9AJX3_9BACI|nr:nucleoside hydrolase [Oceanobacillus picturae]CDO03197.1 Pyrimidine-specific ribonucleoside hydrolase RihA [Oceanobacillus picturae]